MYMKNLDFESWEKEHKKINNNLAVPAYRAFCKAYGINFHFGDRARDFDHNENLAILLDEMPLHGKALSLFNFVNRPYHPFEDDLVSFAYTSWDDFDYENLTLEEVACEMENKDIDIKKSKNESAFYAVIALISSSLLVVLITIRITYSNILPILALIINFALLLVMPRAIYKMKKRIKQREFDQKLFELQQELKDISDRHESHKKDTND